MFVDIVQRKNREKQEITLKEVEDEINEKTGEPRDTEPTAPGVPASDVSPSKITERDLRERGEDASHIPGQQVPDLEVLENENEELKAEIMCKICMDRESAVVFLPCALG
nr:hypothetical protein BaRGS_022832 [Batillaria attramentaria]